MRINIIEYSKSIFVDSKTKHPFYIQRTKANGDEETVAAS